MFKKIILSLCSAFFLFISWPPLGYFTFLIFIAFVPLFILEHRLSKKEINFKEYYIYIYITFLLFNLCTTFWIKHAHFGGAVFAIFCNSFFMASIFYLSAKIKKSIQWKYTFFILPILWIGFEYLHLNWDLSWPWLTLGNVFSSHIHWIQWYAITGVLGGTLWIFIINYLIFQLYKYKFDNYTRRKYCIVIFCSLFIPLIISKLIYNQVNISTSNQTANILIVQPNIDPYSEKFSLSQNQQTTSLLNFIYPKINTRLDFLILPETFLISPIWNHSFEQNLDIKKFNELIQEYDNLNIIVGATILSLSNKSPTAKKLSNHSNQWYKVYNSALYLSHIGINIHHKSKLVPGAEQMPFQNILYPILGDKILKIGNSTAIGNFSKQDSISIFSSPKGYKIAPIICYESIYGDYVRKFINKGAEAIFIITNDGWWKKTSGYKQHSMYAKLRAIETRRYIARSANTGISSVINHLGEIETNIDWNKKEVISYSMPLYHKKTFYVKHGDFLGRLSAFFSAIIVLCFLVFNKLKLKVK